MKRFSFIPLLIGGLSIAAAAPKHGDVRKLDLGKGVTLELVYIPPGKLMMGSTAPEKKWATGIEGGAQPGTTREKYEGVPRTTVPVPK